jgi:hypothetical protein
MNINPKDEVIRFIPQDGASLTDIIQSILNWIFGIIGIVAVVMVIYGGFNLMTSAGDPGKVKKGKNTILYGIIGLVISLLAFAIVNFVLNGIFE